MTTVTKWWRIKIMKKKLNPLNNLAYSIWIFFKQIDWFENDVLTNWRRTSGKEELAYLNGTLRKRLMNNKKSRNFASPFRKWSADILYRSHWLRVLVLLGNWKQCQEPTRILFANIDFSLLEHNIFNRGHSNES